MVRWGEEAVGAGAALGSLFKVAEALRPLGWIRLAQLRTVGGGFEPETVGGRDESKGG